MKPIRLEIEGLNSFAEKQTVDFTELLKEGIFGVFGSTGSGKSTILDAITLALYGRTQKNNNTKREFVNSNRIKAAVSFTFDIMAEGRRRTFEFYREFYASVKSGTVCAYEIVGADKLLLADKKERANALAEEIIGLGYEDFKKCIALPQGEFDRFTKAAKAERLDIVANLFSLQKYGAELYYKAAELYQKFNGEAEKKDAELRGYEEYSAEVIAALKEEISQTAQKTAQAKSAYDIIDAEFKKMQAAIAVEEKYKANAATLKDAESRIALMDNKKKCLELTAYAEQARDAENAVATAEKELAEVQKAAQMHAKELADAKTRAAATGMAECEKERDELYRRHSDLKAAESVNKKALSISADIKNRLDEYKDIEEKLKKKRDEIALINNKLSVAKQTLTDLGEERDVFEQLKNSVAAQTVSREYRYLKAEYEAHNSSELWLAEVIDKKLETAVAVNTCDGDALEYVEREKRNNAERRKAAESTAQFNAELARASAEENALAERAAKVKDEGSQLRTQQNALLAELLEKTGGAEYEKTLIRTELLLKNAEEKLKKLRNEAELAGRKITELSGAVATENTRAENLNIKIAENKEKISEILIKCGIIDKTALAKYLLNDKQKADYRLETNEFFENLTVLRAENTRLCTERAGIGFDSEKEEQVKTERLKLKDELSLLGNNGAILGEKLKIAEQKLERKTALLSEYAFYQKKAETAKKLQGLVYGRKFLEYVAGEYLEEITISASSTLMRLSSGRYFLKYREGKDGEFFVVDNINGGTERSVNTLSGGETFLVSLSLAFSLSAEICSRSDRPIEFFFLDEGFGTLDGELIETVVDCLEKLKNSHFSIGLISHVRELKERINAKIIVTPTNGERGSKIDITY